MGSNSWRKPCRGGPTSGSYAIPSLRLPYIDEVEDTVDGNHISSVSVPFIQTVEESLTKEVDETKEIRTTLESNGEFQNVPGDAVLTRKEDALRIKIQNLEKQLSQSGDNMSKDLKDGSIPSGGPADIVDGAGGSWSLWPFRRSGQMKDFNPGMSMLLHEQVYQVINSSKEGLQSKIGNPQIDYRLWYKENFDYLWTHVLNSDETNAGINKYCDFESKNMLTRVTYETNMNNLNYGDEALEVDVLLAVGERPVTFKKKIRSRRGEEFSFREAIVKANIWLL
ncbi:nodulin-like, Major facilitator superfamily domain protein [Artemisia annua]|uniref:Nodulin-like, Major facilitator superfamily domain protein n=1 Tax=Artemisia annua TaxID=35608 RepID=A0A2U1QBP4_ARTAN|nr:nodulin-like, Major facilitator superfamily domain protein [Artemisia annua]